MRRVASVLRPIVLLAFLVLSVPAGATSYDVSAIVPYPAPTIAATIDSSLNGITVQSPVFRLFGTCQYLAPATIISIYRGVLPVGSTSCGVDGKFQIDVSLSEGANSILVRSSSITDGYGPDSLVGSVTLTMPVETPTQIAEKQKVSSDLLISTDTPFVALTELHRTATIGVVISGGDTPYTVQLNWGDGTIESRTVDAAGTYTFTHEYLKPGTYRAVAVVTDVKGAQREYYFAVVNAGPLSEAGIKGEGTVTKVCNVNSDDPQSGECPEGRRWYEYLVLPVAIVGIFLSGSAVSYLYFKKHYRLRPNRATKHAKKK